MTMRDPSGLARWTVLANWAWLVADVATALAALETIRVLGGFGGVIAPVEQLARADTLTTLAAVCYVPAFVVAGVLVLRWIFVTNRNAHGWSDHLSITPGWNVGWFFIPVASLFKPFTGVRETWQASVDPAAPAAVPVPGVMRLWWGLWLVFCLLGNVSFRLAQHADTPDLLIASGWIDVVGVPIDAALVVALVRVIGRTTAAQATRLGGATLARPNSNA